MGTLNINVGPVTVELIDDDRICKSILGGKPFEPYSLDAWASMCNRQNSTVIDVGAYSGLFSIAAKKLGILDVIAFEPMPEMYDQLHENMKLNDVSFTVLRMAAAAATGKSFLFYDNKVALTSGASLQARGNTKIEIDVIRIDDFTLGDVSAMKIDAERYELPVLAGAKKTIEDCRPSLLVEVLTEKQRGYVEAALPQYRVRGFLDGRNLWMEPR